MAPPNDQPPLLAAIQALEAQRALLGNAAVDTAIAALRAQLSAQEASPAESTAAFSGERKLVTIMFADLSGFTALSERLDPEEVRALMNACFDHLVPVINRYEGTIDKFIGDEIMALFGAPIAHERHAELACRAALDLMEALQIFNNHHQKELQLHIGLNTGLVITGGIGSEGRQQYSVMGDAVNIAARLKDAARSGEIFLGPETQRLAGAFFHFEALPPMSLKGKAEAVKVYRLMGKRSVDENQWVDSRLQTPLVGRQQELSTLLDAFSDLARGQGGRIAVIGEAGIGKSRLVAEALRSTDGQITRAEGRALPHTRQNSFQPAIEILRKLIDSTADSPARHTRARLEEELPLACGVEGPSHLPFLANLLQIPLTGEEEVAVRHLSPAVQRERLFTAFQQYVEGKARRKPLALVWEDLHWADPSTLLLVERLLAACGRAPLLLILLLRPQQEENIWRLHQNARQDYGHHYRTIDLDGLPTVHCAALARHLLDCEEFTAEVEELIFSRAEGNPFFVEELLRSLVDQGVLAVENRKIRTHGVLHNLKLPGTLQGVIAMRIDRLSPAEKTTLQTASVLGRIFGVELLLPLLRSINSDIDLEQVLRQLLQRELLRRREPAGGNQQALIFKHAVTHEVAYQSLLFADRRRLHRLAGETIEELAEGSAEDWNATLAFHFENAEEGEKAVQYLHRAADRAKQLYANEEALAFYERAIEQVTLLRKRQPAGPWEEQLAALLENQGDILQLTGRYEMAAAKFQQSRANRPAAGQVAPARLQRKTGMCFLALSQFDRVLDHLESAKEGLLRASEPRSENWWHDWIELHIDLAHTYYWLNRPDVMMSMAKAVQEEIARHGTTVQLARFGINLTGLYFRQERFLTSNLTVENARRQVETAAQTGNLALQGVALFFHSFSLLWRNEVSQALRLQEEGLALTEKTGDIVWQTRFLTYLSVSHRRLGQVEAADRYAHRGLEAAQTAKMNEYIGLGYANLAWIAWKYGRLKEVEVLARQAAEYAARLPAAYGGVVFVWISAWPLGAARFEQGDISGCVHQFTLMLEPDRKRLDAPLESAMEEVVRAWEANEAQIGGNEVKKVLELARNYRYL